jgi:hypothetical protein
VNIDPPREQVGGCSCRMIRLVENERTTAERELSKSSKEADICEVPSNATTFIQSNYTKTSCTSSCRTSWWCQTSTEPLTNHGPKGHPRPVVLNDAKARCSQWFNFIVQRAGCRKNRKNRVNLLLLTYGASFLRKVKASRRIPS